RKCDKFIRKDNWDIPYNDILSSPVQVADYASCCAKCQATPGCNAFAYAPSTKLCWPKTSTGDNGYGYSHSDRIIGYMQNIRDKTFWKIPVIDRQRQGTL
ncbi:unnamed protein product, partial [Adineta ricciae]